MPQSKNEQQLEGESGLKYEDINLGILKYVGTGQKILDVGCGTGLLDERIMERNNTVYGVDISHETLKIAKKRMTKVYRQDVTKLNLPNIKFDVVILADILEHLEEPSLLLEKIKKHINNDGYIIVSIPNIATWVTRIKLLFGSFTYKDSGTLDKTHLRFFTQRTARELIENSGYDIKKIDITPNLLRPFVPTIKKLRGVNNTQILNSKFYRFYVRYIFPLESIISQFWKNLFAYQFIIIAKPKKV